MQFHYDINEHILSIDNDFHIFGRTELLYLAWSSEIVFRADFRFLRKMLVNLISCKVVYSFNVLRG